MISFCLTSRLRAKTLIALEELELCLCRLGFGRIVCSSWKRGKEGRDDNLCSSGVFANATIFAIVASAVKEDTGYVRFEGMGILAISRLIGRRIDLSEPGRLAASWTMEDCSGKCEGTGMTICTSRSPRAACVIETLTFTYIASHCQSIGPDARRRSSWTSQLAS